MPMAIDNKDLQELVKSELTLAGGAAELLAPHVMQHLEIQDNGIIVKDAQGRIRFNYDGRPMKINHLITEMKTQEMFKNCFD
jgi:hypothetical protein